MWFVALKNKKSYIFLMFFNTVYHFETFVVGNSINEVKNALQVFFPFMFLSTSKAFYA